MMEYPIINQDVIIILSTEIEMEGYWDGSQWWTGHTNYNKDIPLDGSFVVSWRIKE